MAQEFFGLHPNPFPSTNGLGKYRDFCLKPI